MALSEQILKNGEITLAEDIKVNISTLLNTLKEKLGTKIDIETVCEHKVIVFNSNNYKLILLAATITYLGRPHPLYKKRMQLKSWYNDVFDFVKIHDNYSFILVGYYFYDNDYLFAVFDSTQFAKRKLNNSSAHVFINDLYLTKKNGYYEKTDKLKNKIYFFNESNFIDFLCSFFNKNKYTTMYKNNYTNLSEFFSEYIVSKSIFNTKIGDSNNNIFKYIIESLYSFSNSYKGNFKITVNGKNSIDFSFGRSKVILCTPADILIKLDKEYTYFLIFEYEQSLGSLNIVSFYVIEINDSNRSLLLLLGEDVYIKRKDLINTIIFSSFKSEDF